MKALTLLLFIWALLLLACNHQPASTPDALKLEPDYLKGEALFLAKSDSAFYYLNKVTSASKDSLNIAMSYNLMGGIQSDAGDYFGSQESYLASLKYLNQQNKNDQYCVMSNYNELGTSMLRLKNYDDALRYLELALKYNVDETQKNITLNNIALVYKGKNEYAKAVSTYRTIDQQHLNQEQYARFISNLAYASWLNDPSYNAASEFWQAMQIRQHIKDNWGLNASYSHLADYYTKTDHDSALIYAEKMHAAAQKIKSPSDQVEALAKLITLGPPAASKQYFLRYQFLNDSIHSARDSARNQFAVVRFETEKSKADNLVLQKDNTDKKIQIIMLWGLITGIILLAGLTFSWYRKKKQQSMKDQQLRTSQKVHDIVANGLYGIMTGLQHKDQIDKEELIDNIDLLYEQSRDISYESADHHQGTPEKTEKMLTSFATTHTQVLVAGNNSKFWSRLSTPVQKDLELVLRNLMINMKKHSHASSVGIKFENHNDNLIIRYQDDGIGLPDEVQFGNGLRSTENRISGFGGRITFEKNGTKGLKIQINIPIARNDD